MKVKRYLVAMAIVFGLGVFASCEKTSIAEEDVLNEVSLDKDEAKEEDT